MIQASDIDGGEIPKGTVLQCRKPSKFRWRRFHISRCKKRCQVLDIEESNTFVATKTRYIYFTQTSSISLEQWEADLVIMDSLSKYNHGYKYILTVIDVLSKYAWVEPIKTKTGENLVKAFEKILRKPETFHSDKGAEFTNRLFQKYLKKNNIRFFTMKPSAIR